jgi:ankyrin repeat protein
MKRSRLKHIMEYESMLKEQNDDHEMYSMLLGAIRARSVEDVMYALDKGAPVNGIGKEWVLPIIAAADYGEIRIIEVLLENGAEINSTNEWGEIPLHFAAYNGYHDCCEFLIENGAIVDAKNVNQETPLYKAAERGQIDCIKSLLKHNANIDEPEVHKDTPLMQAIWNNKTDAAKFLISQNADVEAISNSDDTALFYAIRMVNEEMVRFLAENGAKLTYDWANPSPLGMAIRRKYKSIARILIEEGVDPFEEFDSPADAVKFFGDDATWLAEYLPIGPDRDKLIRKGKTKNLFGL